MELVRDERREPEVAIHDPSIPTSTFEPETVIRRNEIRAIEKNVVHRICSGQVIVTLSTGVKELVENSIDAGSTSVDVRLTEYGSKLIEVTDNGLGVEEKDFQGLGLKHHTSKLVQFEDLNTIGTFGFRGEALSSLCALAGSLTVITKSENAKQGFKIEYDSKGRIKSKLPVARARGTTVSLRNLFSPLPVRHKEFLKNLKKEFNKMINVLYGYCLGAKGVRISCTNQVERGGPSTLFSVPASSSIRERIASLFGAKQLLTLLELESVEDVDLKILEQYSIDYRTFELSRFRLEGFISKPNSGRSSGDRQFFFINSRPTEPNKIVKLVNEVYSSYSTRGHGIPFVCLDIRTEQETLDVNVTPDKRLIYLQNEKALLATIKATLLYNLSQSSSTFSTTYTQPTLLPFTSSQQQTRTEPESNEVRPVPGTRRPRSFRTASSQPPLTNGPTQLSLFSPQYSGRRSVTGPGHTKPTTPQPTRNLKSVLQRFAVGKHGVTQQSAAIASEPSTSPIPSSLSQQSPINSPYKRPSSILNSSTAKQETTNVTKQPKLMDFLRAHPKKFTHHQDIEEIDLVNEDDEVEFITQETLDLEDSDSICYSSSQLTSTTESSYSSTTVNLDGNEVLLEIILDESFDTLTPEDQDTSAYDDESDRDGVLLEDDTLQQHTYYDDSVLSATSPYSNSQKKSQLKSNAKSIRVDWSEVKTRLRTGHLHSFEEFERCGRKFRALIQPNENKSAEKELRKQLDQTMFNQMRIVGQFNLGFIVAQLGPDLFIIDQHASDEKFNYEELQKSTVLQGQRLIRPLPLNLPAQSENILLQNLDTFQKNGFYFDIHLQGPPTERVQLTKIPYSSSCQFGKQDLEELIFMLEDAPENTFCRPSRVGAMFASRACRKSVMIGTRLSHKDMKLILSNMGRLEQPWNCPHGRPTIRHLLNIHLLPDSHLIHFNHNSLNNNISTLTSFTENNQQDTNLD